MAWRCAEIARFLAPSPVAGSLDRFANHLAADLLRLDRMFVDLDGAGAAAARRDARRGVHALHAIRQALIMRAFLLVAGLPAFSSRHDATRESVFEIAFELKFDALADLLSEIFPAAAPDGLEFTGIAEPADDLGDTPHGYPEIHATTIAPLREIAAAILEISVGLSHAYGAFG
jgi:phosphoenolpyruvate carboxylase